MPRLFVALRPPHPIREYLCELMTGVPAARWQEDAQLHLTLRYIGEVNGHMVEEVAAVLAEVRAPTIEARLAGVGAFSRRERVHTLWAGVAPQEPIRRLFRKVDRALVRLGMEPERRAFVPHITVARLALAANATVETIRWQLDHAALASTAFAVTQLSLYESHLQAEGAEYREIGSWRLRD